MFISLLHVWVAELKGDMIMSKLEISRGCASQNSVSFFLEGEKIGIEAIRQEDGTIITKKVGDEDENEDEAKSMGIVLSIFLACAFIKDLCFIFKLPEWLYHIPTVLFVLDFILVILYIVPDYQLRMYHGAEHKVINWYNKKGNQEFDIKEISRCSRISGRCGTNILSTFVTFQILSSICYNYFNFHIPVIITMILPLCMYKMFPFNLLGLITQFITTKKPTKEHIAVAVEALSILLTEKQ